MKDISDQVSFFSAPCQLPFPYLWTQTNMAITWNGCNRFIYAVHMELHSATLCIHILKKGVITLFSFSTLISNMLTTNFHVNWVDDGIADIVVIVGGGDGDGDVVVVH